MTKAFTKTIMALAGWLMFYQPNAWASGAITCLSPNDQSLSVNIGTGRLPVLGVLDARISLQDQTWSTNAIGDEIKITFGQGFTSESETAIDFTDEIVNEILIGLRIVSAYDDKNGAEAGILHILGSGVFPVICERE